MSNLAKKLKSNSTIKETDYIHHSMIFGHKEQIPTPIPMLNVAFSGQIDGGFGAGVTTFAGPSRHFKTMYALICARSFQTKYPEGIVLWYDSEFGSPPDYFKSVGIDLERVIYTPIKNIEELKFDLVKQLDSLEKGDKVFIGIDSIGNLASKKEIDDALDGKSVADMTRAKQIKSFFRIVTPYLSIKDIPLVVINHTYKTLEMYAKDVVGGGTGNMYSSDNVFIIGRRQEKENDEIAGYEFVLKVEKSRFVKEGSQIAITVKHKGGVDTFSGLLEVALEGGYVVKPNMGWYQRFDPKTNQPLETGKHREKNTGTKEFWTLVFEKTDFIEYIKTKFKVSHSSMFQNIDDEEDLEVGQAPGETDNDTEIA